MRVAYHIRCNAHALLPPYATPLLADDMDWSWHSVGQRADLPQLSRASFFWLVPQGIRFIERNANHAALSVALSIFAGFTRWIRVPHVGQSVLQVKSSVPESSAAGNSTASS